MLCYKYTQRFRVFELLFIVFDYMSRLDKIVLFLYGADDVFKK